MLDYFWRTKVCNSLSRLTTGSYASCSPQNRWTNQSTSDWYARAAKSRSTNFPCRLSADNEPRETLEQLRHCASWTGSSCREHNRNNHRLQSETSFVVHVTGIEYRHSKSRNSSLSAELCSTIFDPCFGSRARVLSSRPIFQTSFQRF